jgi:hypothetical protein
VSHYESDRAIQLIDNADGFNTRGIFVHALPVGQPGLAGIPGSGVNLGQPVTQILSSVVTTA